MKKSYVTIAAAAIFFSTAGAAVQAEEVTVQKGDTLWKLAEQHDVSVEEIKDWNELASDKIVVNEILDIHKEKEYIVNTGDTLWGISKKYNVTVEQLKEWNKLNGDKIVLGQTIVIYPKSSAAADTASGEVMPAPPVQSAQQNNGKEISVEATAYTANCNGCSGTTATGINLKQNPNQKVIAVDPSVIPLGSRVYVEGYGEAIAGDTGGAIKGNKIDVFMPDNQDALNWGRKTVNVKILN